MRIAYISADNGVPVFGSKGCSIHAQEVIRAMLGRGAQVDLFTPRPGGQPPRDLASVRIHSLPYFPSGNPAAREQKALAVNHDLRNELEAAGEFDLVYERYSLWSFAGMKYARLKGIPGVLEVNAPLIDEQAKYRVLIDRRGAEQVAKRTFNAASTLVAVSKGVAKYLRRYANDSQRIHVVPNGVNPRRFSQNSHFGAPASTRSFTIGFVGSLKPWHGLMHLVEAFSILNQRAGNWRLLIVGDGPERQHLEENLEARGLRHLVTFSGAVNPDQVPRLLASMDVAVAPYPDRKDFYFSPLKVYEYMAAGLPVVASEVGQLKDIIHHGKNGLLYTPGDHEMLAAMIDRLYRDSFLRTQIGRAGYQMVMADYTWDTLLQRILGFAGVMPLSKVG